MTQATVTKLNRLLVARLSILHWLPYYKRDDAVADMIAGLTIGLTMMPQSIAYAALAGLSAQYGLYSSFMGSFIYVVFGTIKEVSIGPTSLMAILSVGYTRNLPPEFMILLALLAGCVEFLMGIFKLGFLVDFISLPTVSGFQSATSVIIIGTQLKGLLGIRFKADSFFENIAKLCTHIQEMKRNDTILGLCCVVFLLSLRQITRIKVGSARLQKGLWFVSISRNALVVLITATVAFCLERPGASVFTLTGPVQQGLPPFSFPQLYATAGNVTYSFPDMCSTLGSAILFVPVVAVLANVAIAKAFASGKVVDATQEMMTLGLCNILGSFVQSMPTCGAFTRSAVSNASGVRTPLAGLYSGTIILLAITFLTPYFYFIPRPTLAAILICAVLFMVDYKIIGLMWKSNKLDCFTTIITFLSSLAYGVEMGLVVGVVLNIGNLLRLWARPQISFDVAKTEFGQEYLKITPAIGLFFPAVDFLRNEISKIAFRKENEQLPVLIDCKSLMATDYTATKGIASIIKEFERRNQQLIFLNVNATVKCNIENATNNVQYCSTESKINEYFYMGKESMTREATFPLLADKDVETRTMLKDASIITSCEKLEGVLYERSTMEDTELGNSV